MSSSSFRSTLSMLVTSGLERDKYSKFGHLDRGGGFVAYKFDSDYPESVWWIFSHVGVNMQQP